MISTALRLARNTPQSAPINSNAEALERGRERNIAQEIEGSGDTYVGPAGERVINSNREAHARGRARRQKFVRVVHHVHQRSKPGRILRA